MACSASAAELFSTRIRSDYIVHVLYPISCFQKLNHSTTDLHRVYGYAAQLTVNFGEAVSSALVIALGGVIV